MLKAFRVWNAALAAVLLLAAAGHAANIATKHVVTADQILSAVAAARIPVRSAEVEFLVPMMLNQPTVLKLEHIERSNRTSAFARIACVSSSECLPFFVILHWSNPQECANLPGPPRSESVVHVASPQSKKPLLVRAGHPATLLMQNEKMRIATLILCLENGSLGEQIRVSSLDHKRVGTAEVVDSGLLKGTL